KVYTQVTHNFVRGTVVRYDGTNWVKAQGDSEVNSRVDGIVSAYLDADTFVLTQEGWVDGLTLNAPYTSGDQYWVSPNTAGEMVNTKPSTAGQVIAPLMRADSASSGLFKAETGYEVSVPPLSGWSLINGDMSLIVNHSYVL